MKICNFIKNSKEEVKLGYLSKVYRKYIKIYQYQRIDSMGKISDYGYCGPIADFAKRKKLCSYG